MATLRVLLSLVLTTVGVSGVLVGPASAADAWAKVFSRPYDLDNRIFRTAVVGTDLYVSGNRVYRLNHAGCGLWDNLALPWSPATSGKTSAMASFKSRLYVGTDQGVVFAYDGSNWGNVTGNLPVGWIRDMAEFGGTLYVAYVGQVWQLVDDTTLPHTWAQVWAPTFTNPPVPPQAHPRIETLQVFNGYLYAGVGLDNANGIQIWRTSTGSSWSLFHDETTWGLCSGCVGHVHAMKPFGGYLYIGLYHGVDLYRTDGTPGNWDYFPGAAQAGAGDVFRLAEHNATFYLGTSNLSSAGTPGTPMLYASATGNSGWTPVPGGPAVSAATSSVTALASHGGRLNVATAGDSELAIYQLGPAPAPTCDPPVPDIKVNGSDGPWVALTQGTPLTITLGLKAGSSLAGKNADWWVVLLYYDAVKSAWLPLWLTAQFPLVDVPPIDAWANVNTSGFPKGVYLLALVVDLNVNGLLDLDALYWDAVTMIIQ